MPSKHPICGSGTDSVCSWPAVTFADLEEISDSALPVSSGLVYEEFIIIRPGGGTVGNRRGHHRSSLMAHGKLILESSASDLCLGHK